MEIRRNREEGLLYITQEKYVEKVLEAFWSDQFEILSTLLASYFKLNRSTLPKTNNEKEYMKKVPYLSAVGSLMYVMVCTIPRLGSFS